VIDSRRPRTRADLRDLLASVQNFDGATGKTTFNTRREAEKPLFFLAIDKDGVHEISPTEKPEG